MYIMYRRNADCLNIVDECSIKMFDSLEALADWVCDNSCSYFEQDGVQYHITIRVQDGVDTNWLADVVSIGHLLEFSRAVWPYM